MGEAELEQLCRLTWGMWSPATDWENYPPERRAVWRSLMWVVVAQARNVSPATSLKPDLYRGAIQDLEHTVQSGNDIQRETNRLLSRIASALDTYPAGISSGGVRR